MRELLYLLILLMPFSVFSQSVTNIIWEGDSEKGIYTISFDLSNVIHETEINLKVDYEGASYTPLELEGDVGYGIGNGKAKEIVWNVKKEWGYYPDKLSFNVIIGSASDDGLMLVSGTNQSNKSLYLNGAMTGVGLVGIFMGFKEYGNGKDLYDVYKLNRNEFDSAYNEMSREDHYSEANSHYKRASIFWIVGGAMAGTGGYLLSKKIKQRKELREEISLILKTSDDFPGIALRFNFH